MVKIGYTGKGIISKGIAFTCGEFYDVEQEVADYLVATFPKDFNVIEKVADKKPEKEPAKKPTKRKPRAKANKAEDN